MDELDQEVKSRIMGEAPDACNKSAIRAFLQERGAKGIITLQALSTLLGIHQRTIKNAENSGKLPAVDIRTYRLDDVVEWLFANPRLIAQRRENWELSTESTELIGRIINGSWKGALRCFEFDDLVAEVQYRMLKTPKTPCPESKVVMRILGKIWRDRPQLKTTSLDAINSKGDHV